jgi:hypothetical protein
MDSVIDKVSVGITQLRSHLKETTSFLQEKNQLHQETNQIDLLYPESSMVEIRQYRLRILDNS